MDASLYDADFDTLPAKADRAGREVRFDWRAHRRWSFDRNLFTIGIFWAPIGFLLGQLVVLPFGTGHWIDISWLVGASLASLPTVASLLGYLYHAHRHPCLQCGRYFPRAEVAPAIRYYCADCDIEWSIGFDESDGSGGD